jgi:hypothetical protein
LRRLLLTILCVLSFAISWAAHAQMANPLLEGTWRAKSFAFTFYGNGTYTYVGAMGGPMLETRLSEKGVYAVSGDNLIVQTQSGLIWSSNNYRQNVTPYTTIYRWRLVHTPIGLGLQLVYPKGGAEIFYKQ